MPSAKELLELDGGLSSGAPQRSLAAAKQQFVPEVDPGSLLPEERVKAEGILAQFQCLPNEQKQLLSGRVGGAYERMCLSLPSFLHGSAELRAKWLQAE